MSLWSILVPEATTNLVTNPSVESATTGWALNGAGTTSAQSTAQYRRGAKSLIITPSALTGAGALYSLGSLTAFQVYTAGLDVLGAVGVPYRFQFAKADYALVGTPALFTGDGAWHRYYAYYTAAATEAHYLYVIKNNSDSTAAFYVDGLQLEAKAYYTTYCDGSLALSNAEIQAGFADDGVAWTGTAHASTSTRTATSRRGGRWYDLDSYGFYVSGALGIGAAPVRAARSYYATPKTPGSIYEHSRETERIITLHGLLVGTSRSDLENKRQALAYAMRVNPNGSGDDEPFLIRYAYAVNGDDGEIPVHYEGGLEGGAVEGFTERVAIRLIADYPLWTASYL